ncbi:ferredoxin reductase [Rhodococcus rhodnii]|uniref:Ferredoxin reductase n=2 Tax=Rhodococcus rhodnii TaxID=38312 RepID=R7WWM9_9NOCA|nr:FAD-dependent oxidoreductase [Rhodococcus rhodnii]EOM78549.1 ferredoxin reductase [Rhodococcus rhodnii LMG 5362]TXG91336.1 ferredoxin reductase [Rhodococcus rhodnii]
MTGVPERVVVVGGGIAGVSTVGALRSGGFEGELTLVDAGEFPYDRPPLSKDYLAGGKNLEQIALQPPQWYDDNTIALRTRTSVTALRPAEGAVELSGGELLRADRVVLATGGHAARPPIPGADGERVHVLRTSEDAERLRGALVPGARLLVVGAGLIGAEVASTALGLGCDVVLVDPVAVPLAAGIGDDVATWLHGLHGVRGITTLTAQVKSFTDTGSGIDAVIDGEDDLRSFDAVVVGVGMVAETGLAETAGLEVDRGVVVDPDHVTSNPAVLAVGDITRVRRGGVLAPRAEHWEAAQHDGRRAAATLLGAPAPADTAPWFWTDRHDRHVEGVGRMSDAETTVVRGELGAAAFSAFGFRDGRVVAAVAVDDSNAVRAARRMIDRAIAVDPHKVADPATDLRKLLRG